MISAGKSQAPTMPAMAWQSIGNTPTGNQYGAPRMNFNFGPEESGKQFEKYMKRTDKQQTWNNWMRAGEKLVDSVGQITAMALNYNIQSKYYSLQNKIADNQHDLGIRALELETGRLEAAQRMQREGLDYQKRIARIKSQTAVAVEQLKQKGTTKRAEIFAAMNAFHRTNYQYGRPTFQTSVMS